MSKKGLDEVILDLEEAIYYDGTFKNKNKVKKILAKYALDVANDNKLYEEAVDVEFSGDENETKSSIAVTSQA